MKTRFILPALIAVGLLPLLSGCIYSREIAATQRSIARENPDVDFDAAFMLSLGRGTFGTLSELASFVDVDEVRLASDYLRRIRHVKVGMYKIDSEFEGHLQLDNVPHLRRGGWLTLARVREENGDDVAVLYRERFGEVRDLFVITLSDLDLVIVRVTGNFSTLVADVLYDFADRIPQFVPAEWKQRGSMSGNADPEDELQPDRIGVELRPVKD